MIGLHLGLRIALVCAAAGCLNVLLAAMDSALAETPHVLTTATVSSAAMASPEVQPEAIVTTAPGESAETLRRSLRWDRIASEQGYSISQVMALAMKHNPNWSTYAANHADAHAELLKAHAFPNPEVEVEYGREKARESEDGKRPSSGVWSLSVSQPFELPGKRLARQLEAQAGFAVVDGQAREYGAMLRTDVLEAYYTVQYHAALEALYDGLVENARSILATAERRKELGDAGAVEGINARIELLRAEKDRNSARRRKEGARAALNALTGRKLPASFKLRESFDDTPRQMNLDQTVRRALECHPRLLRLAAELEQRYASLKRERTAWWPDIKLGVRKSREFDTNGVAVTAGVEIPLWNRNQGGIAKAEASACKTHGDITVAMNEIRRDVEVAWQNHEMAREQIASYRDGLKQASEDCLAVAWTQYREGDAGYLEVLNARRVLQETEHAYIEVLYDAAIARVRLDRASGVLDRKPSSSGSAKAEGKRNARD